MMYFVLYSTAAYDGTSVEEFDTKESLLAFLNSHAENADFWFRVFHGHELKFEPAEVVKAYRIKP